MPLPRLVSCPLSLAWLAIMLIGGLAVPLAALTSELAAAEPAQSAADRARIPWTTSRVVGSPDPPPPFTVVRAFPNLKFEHPVLLARCPGSDRLFIGEQAGVLHSFVNEPDAKAELFFDLRTELTTIHLHPQAQGVESVYGLVFHPDFAMNRQCFVCYTLRGKKGGERNLADGTRVSRFTVTAADPPRIDPSSEEIVLTFPQGGHNGGDIHFGPDGMLYISTGDATSPNPPDDLNTGQDISDLLASILRIDVDRKDAGKNYAVPKDNPFLDTAGARPEVWAYGFRNPWRMSFDRMTGELFVGDVGWELWEMIHRIEKGGNYGWSAMEGPQPIKPEQIGPTPVLPALIALPHTIAASVTGGYVYRGKKFPELTGAYVFGDWETRRLWAARVGGDRTREMPEIARPAVRVAAFGEDNDGELYLLDYDAGTLHTIERNNQGSQNADFPTKLSQTGLFASVEQHTPAAGVVPFTVSSRQWQDGATAEYLIALPGDSSVTLHASGKPVPGLVYWHNFRMHFPKDAVLLRTLSLGNRRVETQLLHFEGADWRAYTFAWRDDQTDADLVPADGSEKELMDGQQQRVWQFYSRSQCMSCHSNQSEYALAFLPEQLNRPGLGGENQLVALTEAGIIRRAGGDGAPLPLLDTASAAKERRIANPADESEPLEARARAYLHANCGHCHSDHGGGTVPLRLQFPTPVAEMKAVGVRPTRGDFALPDAFIVKPGDPYASTLYFRMAKFGRDRMPHLGSERPDEAGLKIIERWIESMAASPATEAPVDGVQPEKLLDDPRGAMLLARKLGRGELQPAHQQSLLAAAANRPPGLIRDLFEGYLPAGKERKLGSSPRPRSILALHGDAGRGETMFWSSAVNCGRCHKIGDRGVKVGPDLSNIGKLRAKEDLLESMLEPSRRIEPNYSSYVARAVDGRVVTGVVMKRDQAGVVLRDGQDKEIALATQDIDRLRPSPKSLMPEGQFAGLTAQEAADLLEYLASRK
ncbi:MAG: PQQ-dependent sugar dehydrogenase [Planctomycetaceae bacterium]|nr:PQQ-dependent sugar dehydrogenase [Planctomycetaceae bacterium]